MKRKITSYTVTSPLISKPVSFAVAADLHNAPYDDVLAVFRQVDAVLVPGDLLNRHRLGWEQARRFLEEVPGICPVFYSLGNHERRYPVLPCWLEMVECSGVTLLDNATAQFGEVSLGGLSSVSRKEQPDRGVLSELSAMPGFRLLLCHHPEYYPRYVADYDIDLTLAGHAHGGQVQVMGRGLYAPNQGLLPRLTDGFYYHDRLLVSRGMTNSAAAPRIANPCELIVLRLQPAVACSVRSKRAEGRG